MSEQPRVDVVVATNRASPYFEETLASVTAQTWTDWQLIVVDDGSPDPDSLRSLVSEVPGALLLRQRASGVSAARNRGYRAGAGDLIAFLDDDDVWHPDRLAGQVTAWRDAPHHLAAYSGGWYLGPDGRLGGTWPARQATSADFLSGRVALPRIVTLLVRRDVCEAVGGFDEGFALAEDSEFILRLAMRGEMLAVPESLVGYRRHPVNVSAAPPGRGRQASERLLALHIERAESQGSAQLAALLRQNRRAFRRASAADAVGTSLGALRTGRLRLSLSEAWWALEHAPRAAATEIGRRVSRRVLSLASPRNLRGPR